MSIINKYERRTSEAIYYDKTIFNGLMSNIIKATIPKVVFEEDGYIPDFKNEQYVIGPTHGEVYEDIRIAIGYCNADVVIATQYGFEQDSTLPSVCEFSGGIIRFCRGNIESRGEVIKIMSESLNDRKRSVVIFPAGSFNNSMNEIVPPIFPGIIRASLESSVPILAMAFIKDSQGVIHAKCAKVEYTIDEKDEVKRKTLIKEYAEDYRSILAGLYYDLIQKYSCTNEAKIGDIIPSINEVAKEEYNYTERENLIDQMIDQIISFPKLSNDMKDIFEFLRVVYHNPYSIEWRNSEVIDNYRKNNYFNKVFSILLSLKNEAEIRKVITSLTHFEIRRQYYMYTSKFKYKNAEGLERIEKDEVNHNYNFYKPYTIIGENGEEGIINNDHYIEILNSTPCLAKEFEYEALVGNTEFYHDENGEIQAEGLREYLKGVGMQPDNIKGIPELSL